MPTSSQHVLSGGNARDAFVTRARERFDAAARAGKAVLRFAVGDRPARLEVASSRLADLLLPALGHLKPAGPGTPQLVIRAWAGAASAPPLPRGALDGRRVNGELPGWGGTLQAALDIDFGLLSVYDRAAGEALVWVRDDRGVPASREAAVLRTILHWWAMDHGGLLVHAAAVGVPSGGVLVAGPSGAGKSTAAVAGVSNGLVFAGDDFVLVEPHPDPVAHSVCGSAKLEAAHRRRVFPELVPVPRSGGSADDKDVLSIGAHWPDRLVRRVGLRAILVPTPPQPGVGSRIEPASRGVALRALIPGLYALPGARQEAFERLGALARRLPCYRWHVGDSPTRAAAAVRELLAGSAA